MTRDEAITEDCKYFRLSLQIQAMTRSEDEIRKMAAAQIDFYAAIGMLKLDEPKTIKESLDEAYRGYVSLTPSGLLQELDRVGLKIVKA